MFRRRRSEDADRDEFDYDEPEQPAGVARAEGGPWDAEEPFPALDRVDLGSLQVPIGPEHEIQLVMAEQHGAWVTIRYRESEVQIQAFAAARRGALWDDVRAEIAAEVNTAGGRSQETEGSFGIELMAQVSAEPGQPAAQIECIDLERQHRIVDGHRRWRDARPAGTDPGGDRERNRRSRGRGLRRFRRPRRPDDRTRGARRPGRHVVAHRELSRLPLRGLRSGPRAPRRDAGAPVRRDAARIQSRARRSSASSTACSSPATVIAQTIRSTASSARAGREPGRADPPHPLSDSVRKDRRRGSPRCGRNRGRRSVPCARESEMGEDL